MRAQPRVLVVDDEPLVAEGLAFRLAGDERLSIVGAAASPCQAIEQVATLQPDVTLLEVRLKGSDGIALIETLAQRPPGMAVLVLSRHGDPELVRIPADRSGMRCSVTARVRDSPSVRRWSWLGPASARRIASSPRMGLPTWGPTSAGGRNSTTKRWLRM